MIKLEFWDKESPLTFPDDIERTPRQVRKEFPGQTADGAVTVIEYLPDENGIVGAIYTLAQLVQLYKIDDTLTDDEALSEVEYIRNNPPSPNPDLAPLTRRDMQLLEQHLTELELTILEASNV